MMVQQLEPFFGRIIRRQYLALSIFGVDRVQQIVDCDPIGGGLDRTLNCPIDRTLLGPLHNRRKDRTGHEIAAVQDLVLAVPETDGQEPVLVSSFEDGLYSMNNQCFAGCGLIVAVSRNKRQIKRQLWREIDLENLRRRLAVGPVYLDLSINPS